MAKAVQKYLPDTLSQTDKGHMKHKRKGLCSTKSHSKENAKTMEDMTPVKVAETHNHLFAAMCTVNPKDGTMYLDLTGNFPIQSINGMMTVLVIYDWTSNTILPLPIKDAKDELLVAAFTMQVKYLTK
jgi:hypothetical protein